MVALKIKLGLASAMAQKEGIAGFDELLEGLKGQADRVIDTVREFARGIYPPLLEAEGLVSALNANFRKASIPVSLQAGGVGRYPKEVEATTYFCVLQAVEHAVARNAGSVQVFLDESGGSLTFEARDDGVEVDQLADHLVNLVDRLDAAGGSLEVTSRPGHGTLLVGKLSAEQMVTT